MGIYSAPYTELWTGGVEGASFTKLCDVTHEITVRIDVIILRRK
jgi:hypothetical protein